MKRPILILTSVILLLFVSFNTVFARSGCCSHHGGVCGCGCCDGSSLSNTCTPYYPECSRPTVDINTPKPYTGSTTTVRPTDPVSQTSVSTPEVLAASTEEPAASQTTSNLDPISTFAVLGVLLFGGYKGLTWVARKTNPVA